MSAESKMDANRAHAAQMPESPTREQSGPYPDLVHPEGIREPTSTTDLKVLRNGYFLKARDEIKQIIKHMDRMIERDAAASHNETTSSWNPVADSS